MLLFLSNRYKPKTPENMLDTYLFIDDFFFLNKTLLIMQSFVICEGCYEQRVLQYIRHSLEWWVLSSCSCSGTIMPITLLWAVDVYGRVYSLSTAGQRWERADDSLLELKRVSAGKGRCWGIGCDHHVYLNMMPSETPIRYREETYENQVGQGCIF